MRSLAGLLPTPPSRSRSRVSRRHCGEGLRPRLPRAGEWQLCRRAETWHSSSPRRLLREPRRTELLSAGSSSLRREVLAGDCWKTSSGSSSSSTMEGRAFSGAAPLSGRGCRRAGGQDWSQARPSLPRPPPSPRQGTNLWRLRQPRGPGVAAEPLQGEQMVPVQQQEGPPAQLHRDQPRARSPPSLSVPPLDNQTFPSPTHQPQYQPLLSLTRSPSSAAAVSMMSCPTLA